MSKSNTLKALQRYRNAVSPETLARDTGQPVSTVIVDLASLEMNGKAVYKADKWRFSPENEKISALPRIYKVRIVVERWKDKLTGRFVPDPNKPQKVKTAFKNRPRVLPPMPRGKHEVGDDGILIFKRFEGGNPVFTVVFPKLRESYSAGEITLSEVKQIEKDIADGLEQEWLADPDNQKEALKKGYLNDKGKRAAQTQKNKVTALQQQQPELLRQELNTLKTKYQLLKRKDTKTATSLLRKINRYEKALSVPLTRFTPAKKTAFQVGSTAPQKKSTLEPLEGIEEDISFATYRNAFLNTSHDPEKLGVIEREQYKRALTNAYTFLEKVANTEDKKAILYDEFAKFRSGYKQKYLAYLSTHTRIASPMVTGGANFNSTRNDKAHRSLSNRINDLESYYEKGLAGIEKKINPKKAVTHTEKAIIVKNEHEQRLEANRIFKLKITYVEKLQKLREIGYPEPETTFKRLPFNAIELQNSRQKAKRAEGKVNSLEGTSKEQVINGVRMVQDEAADRLKLYFDGKPSPETVTALKKKAFKWSPSNKAWQRQLTSNAVYDATLLLREYKA